MCNFGQRLFSSPGLRGTQGLGCCTLGGVSVLAGRREEGAWGHTSRSLTSPPGGCRAGGPPGDAVTPSALSPASGVSPESLRQWRCLVHSLTIAPAWVQGPLSTPKKVLAPGQLAAPGCRRPRGRRATVPGDTSPWITLQEMQDQGEVAPGDRGRHNWDAVGVDAGMLLPPCSLQHTTYNLTCSRACS